MTDPDQGEPSASESFFTIAVQECDPHLNVSTRYMPRILLGSAFEGFEHLRRAVAGAAFATRLPVKQMEHAPRNMDASEALEWSKDAVRQSDIVVVLLGLRAGSYPFDTPTVFTPDTYFQTEVRWARHEKKRILAYYIGSIETWPDRKLLFSTREEQMASTLNPRRGSYDWITLGGLASQLE